MKNQIVAKPKIADFISFKIEIPEKYLSANGELHYIVEEEQNALFQYLLNIFFRKIKNQKFFNKNIVAELEYLCESYFDFKYSESLESQDLIDDYDNF
jgi:hypothetical protein